MPSWPQEPIEVSMKLKMAKDSLFAILLRSSWWISFAIAAGIAVAALLVLPENYAIAGALGGTPFVVIGAIAAWRQLRAPSAARVSSTLEAAGAMSWRDFAGAIEDAFRRDGYAVTRLPGPQADFEIVKAGRTALVSCKRWKAATTGAEPLRDLDAAREAREAHEGIYVALGGVTDNARRFAAGHRIRILQGADLVALLPQIARRQKARRPSG
jgi:restriction system protein